MDPMQPILPKRVTEMAFSPMELTYLELLLELEILPPTMLLLTWAGLIQTLMTVYILSFVVKKLLD